MHGIIRWFANNGVAANLLMILIVAGGLLTLTTLTQEVFPETDSDMVQVRVPYPGASPDETEEALVVRVEEAIQDLEGIKKLRSTAAEGMGTVLAELEPGTDIQKLVNDIKGRVDAIDTFPEEAEKPVVEEVVIRRQEGVQDRGDE